MNKIIIFDVNETLLDLKSLDPHFEKIFGDSSVRKQWFAQFIQNAFISIITNSYEQFGKIGAGALDMIAQRMGIKLKNEDKIALLGQMKNLTPHPEVAESLKLLKDAGFRLFTLTNSTEEVVTAQIENAGLSQYFERMFSAHSVKRLKPAIEPYQMVANKLGVHISDIRLIAAHAWDISGALRAGCKAAFIARPGMVLDPLSESPDIVGSNLIEVASKIVENNTQSY